MILAPILAQLIYFAVSRKREYLADASAATFTRYPEGLASALEKISRAPDKLGGVTSATAPMYIINPLKRANKMAANATSTHPPIDERIKILRSMGGQGFAAYDASYRGVKGGGGIIPGSALKEDGAVGEAPRDVPKREKVSASQREIARQVDDLFYRKDGYRAVDCSCGTILKIPPDFESHAAKCPRCGTLHKTA
jgi:heat shock protein HtpX